MHGAFVDGAGWQAVYEISQSVRDSPTRGTAARSGGLQCTGAAREVERLRLLRRSLRL